MLPAGTEKSITDIDRHRELISQRHAKMPTPAIDPASSPKPRMAGPLERGHDLQ